MNEPSKFEIVLQLPIALSTNLQKDLEYSKIPRFRIIEIDIKQYGNEPNIFLLTTLIHPEDLNPEEIDPSKLHKLKDQIVSLISISSMVPVRLLSSGLFTFHLGENHYRQTSLGPGKIEGPPMLLESVEPLITGQFLSERHSAAVYLIWQAINSSQPLYRFINTAMCIDIISVDDTSEPSSVNPTCSRCGYLLENCPECNKGWTIPNTLRNKARFLIKDEKLLSRFIRVRNKVFHGSFKLEDDKLRKELQSLNILLLIVVRNYIGNKIGLNPIQEKDLHWTLEDRRFHASVDYSTPLSKA